MSIRQLGREARAKKRSTKQHRDIIQNIGREWLYVEGYPERMRRSWDDNRGAWPHRVKTTSTGPHAASSKTQYEDPLYERNVIVAWSVRSDADAKRVENRVKAILAQHDIPLRGAWHDIEPNNMVEIVTWAATVEGVELLTEREYWKLIDQLYDQRARKRAAG